MMFGNSEYWKQYREKMAQEKAAPEEVHEIVDPVTGWRFGYLCGLGFGAFDALKLAEERTVDLRDAERMVQAGCSHETAMRILL